MHRFEPCRTIRRLSACVLLVALSSCTSEQETVQLLALTSGSDINFKELLYGRGLGFALPPSICGGQCADATYARARAATVRLSSSGCAGIAVSNSWVLTAAHCMQQPPVYIVFGDHSGDPIPRAVDSRRDFCVHPDYESHPTKGETSDLALVPFLGGAPATYSLQSTSPPREGDPVIGLLWGTVQLPERERDCFARTVGMKAFSNQACQVAHGRDSQPKDIDDVEFCAGDSSSSIFLGASGSPVFRDLGALGTGELVGIVSDVRGTGGCRDPWDIHTKIDPVWIQKILAGQTAGNCK